MKIHLTSAAHDFISEVTRRCEGEVGGMGYCHVENDHTVVVSHAFLIGQEVSTGSVEFDPDAIAIACERAAIEGRIEELRFSWHSHGSMGTFWSATDDDGISKYLSGGTPWLASLVVNHKADMLGRIDVANVLIAGVAQFREVKVTAEIADRTNGRALAEIAEFVREAPPRWKKPLMAPRTNMRLHEIPDRDWLDDDDEILGDRVFTG